MTIQWTCTCGHKNKTEWTKTLVCERCKKEVECFQVFWESKNPDAKDILKPDARFIC